jgi:hypothetical protein
MCPDCGFPLAEQSVLGKLKVGDIMHFGEVMFDACHGGTYCNDTAWQVLAVEADKVLVIANKVIELRSYNFGWGDDDTTWEHCRLRQWLNGAFYQGLPRAMRDATTITRVLNQRPRFFGGRKKDDDTQDKVFLISIDEAREYFWQNKNRQTGIDLTPETIAWYKERTGWDLPDQLRTYGGVIWWLRSPGRFTDAAACVMDDGEIDERGGQINYNDSFGVRPALWISDLFFHNVNKKEASPVITLS